MATAASNPPQHRVYLPDLIQIDQTRDLMRMTRAVFDYLKTRPKENFATLERMLRQQNGCWTRLIAKEVNPKHPLNPEFRGEKRRYELIISMRPPEAGLLELQLLAGDQETNLARLPNAGSYNYRNQAQADRIIASLGDQFIPAKKA